MKRRREDRSVKWIVAGIGFKTQNQNYADPPQCSTDSYHRKFSHQVDKSGQSRRSERSGCCTFPTTTVQSESLSVPSDCVVAVDGGRLQGSDLPERRRIYLFECDKLIILCYQFIGPQMRDTFDWEADDKFSRMDYLYYHQERGIG